MEYLDYTKSVEEAKLVKNDTTWGSLRALIVEYMTHPLTHPENRLWKIERPVSFKGIGFTLYYDNYIVCEIRQDATGDWTITDHYECDHDMHASVIRQLVKLLSVKYRIQISNAAKHCGFRKD